MIKEKTRQTKISNVILYYCQIYIYLMNKERYIKLNY